MQSRYKNYTLNGCNAIFAKAQSLFREISLASKEATVVANPCSVAQIQVEVGTSGYQGTFLK